MARGAYAGTGAASRAIDWLVHALLLARSLLFSARGGHGDVRAVEELMNADVFKGQWKQLKGDIRMRWNQLTDDDIDTIDGAIDKLEGRLQERYGWEKERISREIESWGRDRGVWA